MRLATGRDGPDRMGCSRPSAGSKQISARQKVKVSVRRGDLIDGLRGKRPDESRYAVAARCESADTSLCVLDRSLTAGTSAPSSQVNPDAVKPEGLVSGVRRSRPPLISIFATAAQLSPNKGMPQSNAGPIDKANEPPNLGRCAQSHGSDLSESSGRSQCRVQERSLSGKS